LVISISLQFDGIKHRKQEREKSSYEYSYREDYKKARKMGIIRSMAVGTVNQIREVVMYTMRPFQLMSGANSFPAWDFIYSFLMYVASAFIVILVFLVMYFVLLTGGIITGISAANPLAEAFGTAQVTMLVYIQTLWQMAIVFVAIIYWLGYVVGPKVLVGAYRMFIRSVWVRGWRQILFRTLVVPFVASFTAIIFIWAVPFLFFKMKMIFLGLIYLIPAMVVSFIAGLIMITGWLAFWRNMRDYLYKRANESYTVSFFILFATFKGFAVIAGIPLIVKLSQYIVAYGITYAFNPEPIKDTIIGQILYQAINSLWQINPFNILFVIMTVFIVAVALILEVFDLIQLSSVIPQLLRKAMLRGLRISQEYGEPGFLTTIDVKQPQLEIMKLVIIYGTVIGYFVFTMFIVGYVIPALFRVAILTI